MKKTMNKLEYVWLVLFLIITILWCVGSFFLIGFSLFIIIPLIIPKIWITIGYGVILMGLINILIQKINK